MCKELWLHNCATLAFLEDHKTKYVKRLGSPIDYTVTGQIEVYSCVPDTLSCLCSICSLGPLSYKPTLITSGLNECASYLILPRGNSSLKLWWSKQPELKMIALPQMAQGLQRNPYVICISMVSQSERAPRSASPPPICNVFYCMGRIKNKGLWMFWHPRAEMLLRSLVNNLEFWNQYDRSKTVHFTIYWTHVLFFVPLKSPTTVCLNMNLLLNCNV